MTSHSGGVRRAVGAFGERFGRPARFAAAAPGRVNLIGEHTDYNDGFVLPMAIDRWCVCVAAPAVSAPSRLVALDLGETEEASLEDFRRRGDAARAELRPWARYVVGSLVEHAAGLGLEGMPELDLLVTSSVPFGSGLSSSASLETACATMLEAAVGTAGDPVARALDCQRAEHRWAGVPCGLMDQLSSSCGVAGHAILIDCRDVSVAPAPLPDAREAVVLVVNSGVHHDLAAGEYARRRAACERAAARLGAASLREVERLEDVDWTVLDGEQARCVKHVVTENARVLAAVDALRAGDLREFGRLMLDSHTSLRDDYRVSCAELDSIVEIAMRTPGVFGARMTGGGFGGCAVVLASPGGAESLTARLPVEYRAVTGVGCTVERMRAVGPASATVLA